jgi:ATP-dependent phosphofructokinase / diphosphate-dependent phosphofructokinase
MRIGILTGGGDVPGLNPCIKAVVNQAAANGWEVIGIRNGWAGLLEFDFADEEASRAKCLEPLTVATVRTIDRAGGTYLHTSRTNPQRVRERDLPAHLAGQHTFDDGRPYADCTAHVLEVLHRERIDALVPIGGDDTLSFAVRLHRGGRSVPWPCRRPWTTTCSAPTTASASARPSPAASSTINALRTPAGSHERIAVVELFGRNSGETALIAAYLADADRALISEVPFDVERLAANWWSQDRNENPSNYAIVVVSEGASMIGGQVVEYGQEDAYGHKKLGGIGQHRGRGAEPAHRHRHRAAAVGIPDASRRSRLARPDGGVPPTAPWR